VYGRKKIEEDNFPLCNQLLPPFFGGFFFFLDLKKLK